MDHAALAGALFRKGYSCSQAVVVAFCDLTGLTQEQAARFSSSFGGGMGRMRETCGGVTGILMVAGMLYGYHDPEDNEKKAAHYRLVQDLTAKFRQRAGTISCRELLGNPSTDPTPTPRTEDFYATRPCLKLVMLGAEILDKYIAEHPVPVGNPL